MASGKTDPAVLSIQRALLARTHAKLALLAALRAEEDARATIGTVPPDIAHEVSQRTRAYREAERSVGLLVRVRDLV